MLMGNIRILVADDEYYICEGLKEALAKEGYVVDVAHDGLEAELFLKNNVYHATVFDLKMPGRDGLYLLQLVRDSSPDTGVIMITAFGEVETAVDAMRLGAYDYLTKPVDLKRLRLSLQHLLDRQALVAENKELRARLGSSETFGEIVHHSAAMAQVCDVIGQAAMTNVPVLITGETGTGKELVTRAIHQRSSREKQPLIAMNCGAFSESLFEAELFGYVKGAFTGADTNKHGHFAAAERGTLFFDEVGEIPLANQVDLLRVLEEKAYRPVGSTQSTKMDVRTIFATNRDLENEVSEGRFREDLYYRLNVVPIRLPPLRERHEDIPLLVETFLDQLCVLHHKSRKQLDTDAMQQMLNYEWPGNVRELKNVIERLVVTCPDQEVKRHQLPSRVRTAKDEPKVVGLKAGMSIEQAERILIANTLQDITSNRKEAAELLGISLRALQYKIKKYELRS
ncbi:MAG: sigma-54-dependent Fis family transcriptional regulator [Candidatus Latescibacteria bacterium]|nr:sigma-54-dependent Fis family transcriptional regulator [Candidatus Latescibacterota bacterium]